MKLYSKIKKRLAKKLIGNRYNTLLIGSKLKVGDMIHGCFGYNAIINDIMPVISDHASPYRKFKKGYYILDFDIETDHGGCSLTHCCTFPIPSKSEILKYWKNVMANSTWEYGEQTKKIQEAIKRGEDPFDEKGMLLPQYKIAEFSDHISVA